MENLTNEQLLMIWNEGYKEISKDEIHHKAIASAKKIKTAVAKHDKVCVGYSTGKDSIVVYDLCQKCGIDFTPILWITMFQFKMHKEWIKKKAPSNLQVKRIERPNWQDLQSDEDLVFVASQAANTTYMRHKWNAQKKTLINDGYDLFITGRRIAENNSCGSYKSGFLKKGKYYDTLSPIADWTIEEVIAYIRYNDLELPPQYLNTENGLTFGSVAWTERRRYGHMKSNIQERWKEVYNVEPDIVIEAAQYLESARTFLEGV